MHKVGNVCFLLLLPCLVAPHLSEEVFKFVEDYFTFKSVRIISCFTCSKRGTYIAAAMFPAFTGKTNLEIILLVASESSKLTTLSSPPPEKAEFQFISSRHLKICCVTSPKCRHPTLISVLTRWFHQKSMRFVSPHPSHTPTAYSHCLYSYYCTAPAVSTVITAQNHYRPYSHSCRQLPSH